MDEREVLDGRDRSGGSAERGTPQYCVKLAEDAFKAGDLVLAMEHFREACQEWNTHWRIASKVMDKQIAEMSDQELVLLENDLMAQMPMTVSYFQHASETARTLGKKDIWEQCLLIAQEAKFAWELAEKICLRRLGGGAGAERER